MKMNGLLEAGCADNLEDAVRIREEKGNGQPIAAGFKRDAASTSERRLRFWLVEDDEVVRDLIAEVLNRSGAIECARQFSSAEAVLDALSQETPPEAILTDINMGGMTGIEAIRPIRERASSTRVFIMTTFYDSKKAADALSLGASAFFLKGDDWERTIERIQEIFAGPAPENFVARANWESQTADCGAALRVSSPGRLKCPLKESEGAGPGTLQPSTPPWGARALAFVRAFMQRSPARQPSVPH
jgi:CheY-like chemotaxis protein